MKQAYLHNSNALRDITSHDFIKLLIVSAIVINPG